MQYQSASPLPSQGDARVYTHHPLALYPDPMRIPVAIPLPRRGAGRHAPVVWAGGIGGRRGLLRGATTCGMPTE